MLLIVKKGHGWQHGSFLTSDVAESEIYDLQQHNWNWIAARSSFVAVFVELENQLHITEEESEVQFEEWIRFITAPPSATPPPFCSTSSWLIGQVLAKWQDLTRLVLSCCAFYSLLNFLEQKAWQCRSFAVQHSTYCIRSIVVYWMFYTQSFISYELLHYKRF